MHRLPKYLLPLRNELCGTKFWLLLGREVGIEEVLLVGVGTTFCEVLGVLVPFLDCALAAKKEENTKMATAITFTEVKLACMFQLFRLCYLFDFELINESKA